MYIENAALSSIGDALTILGLMVFFGLGFFALLGALMAYNPKLRGRAIPRGTANKRITNCALARVHAQIQAYDAENRAAMRSRFA